MKLVWDLFIILGVPIALGVVSQCSKGVSVYIRELTRGRGSNEARERAKAEMKQMGPDLCLIALGGDFGAGSYIYAVGGPFLLNEFGALLIVHFAMFSISTTLLVLSATDRVRIWYNDLLGLSAIMLTAAVILFLR